MITISNSVRFKPYVTVQREDMWRLPLDVFILGKEGQVGSAREA